MNDSVSGVEIRDDAIYDLNALRRMGWGASALRAARRQGLIVRRCGRKSWVLGADLRKHILDRAIIVK